MGKCKCVVVRVAILTQYQWGNGVRFGYKAVCSDCGGLIGWYERRNVGAIVDAVVAKSDAKEVKQLWRK